MPARKLRQLLNKTFVSIHALLSNNLLTIFPHTEIQQLVKADRLKRPEIVIIIATVY